YHDMILGAAAGIMLAAAVLGLIMPAAEMKIPGALWMTVLGTACGALLISVLDRITPHLHHIAGLDNAQEERHAASGSMSKTLLFISAIAIHKIPEGLAAGISFGTEDLSDILMVSGSIALQNIPEAMVIIVPLLAIRVSVKRTLLISAGIGMISMVSTVAGFGMVAVMQGFLPLILAVAGGAMLYVVSDELIPATHAHGNEKPATFSLIAGFMLIVIFQQILP
ncbi:MAG: ZIP family metal transporter, partial [Lentisphaeria bacterium]|nr:ZIP family metal transporter [Lentisphaeria bacterium]